MYAEIRKNVPNLTLNFLTLTFENFDQIEALSCLMFVKYLMVKVQGLKYYVTEECNILVGVWGEAPTKF